MATKQKNSSVKASNTLRTGEPRKRTGREAGSIKRSHSYSYLNSTTHAKYRRNNEYF